jgi:hypothetical protein
MSPAGSVVVFILILVVLVVVLFVATMDKGTRNLARSKNSQLVESRTPTPTPDAINVDDAAIAKRLNALAPKARVRDPHSVDIGGNHS